MGIFRALIRLISRVFAVFGLAAFIVAALLMDFLHRSRVDTTPRSLPPIAVVFTGQFDRVHMGLDLLSAGEVERLFITGANGPAGVRPDRFVTQFDLTEDEIALLETGRIILAPDANSTFENALEAGCWLQEQPKVRAVALITSRTHMARASVALRNEIWPIDVVRVYSDPLEPYDEWLLDLRAFGAFVATWGITLLPHRFWPANEPALCLADAPAADATAKNLPLRA